MPGRPVHGALTAAFVQALLFEPVLLCAGVRMGMSRQTAIVRGRSRLRQKLRRNMGPAPTAGRRARGALTTVLAPIRRPERERSIACVPTAIRWRIAIAPEPSRHLPKRPGSMGPAPIAGRPDRGAPTAALAPRRQPGRAL